MTKSTPRLATFVWIFAFLLIGLSSIVLRYLVQPYPIFNAIHDDYLLVQLAHNIQQTGWLGDWRLNSLSKGPGYPLFLAWTHFLPWAPTVTLQFGVVGAAAIAAVELIKRGYRYIVAIGIFTFIVFFPIFYGWPYSRFYRDGLLTVLALFIAVLILRLSRLLWDYSRKRDLINILITSGFLGLFIGWFYITKVNWQFLVLPLVIMVVFAVYRLWKIKAGKTRLYIVALSTIFVIFSASIFPAYTAIKNLRNYGVFLTDDFSQGGYAAAITQMMRVDDEDRPEYVDVTHTMRTKIYGVSPTAKLLEPYLESEPGVGWKSSSCSALNICDESALWFPWELRDAAFGAGFTDTPQEFQKKMYAVANEISVACDAGKLSCHSPGIAPGLRSISTISPRLVIDAFGNGLQQIFSLSSASFNRDPIMPPSGDVLAVWNETVSDYGNISPSVSSWNPGSRNVDGMTNWLRSLFLVVWPFVLVVGAIGLTLRSRDKQQNKGDLQGIGLSFILSGLISIGLLSLMEADGGLYLIGGGNLYLLSSYPFFIVGSIIGVLRVWDFVGGKHNQ